MLGLSDYKNNNTKPVKRLTNEEVTNHTAPLWKYKQIPYNEPSPSKEYETRYINNEEYSILGASVRGKKHKHEGSNCDDIFKFDCVDDWVIIVVSDGAGSKKLSRIGAKVSCETVVTAMKNGYEKLKNDSLDLIANLGQPSESQIFLNSCRSIANVIQKAVMEGILAVENNYRVCKKNENYIQYLGREVQYTDFAATLLAAAIIPVFVGCEKQHLIVSIQIGDGAIIILNESEKAKNAIKIMGKADEGNFAGETEFLTSNGMKNIETLMNRTQITRKKFSHFMIMTDGVSDDYFPIGIHGLKLYIDLILNGILDNSEIENKNKQYSIPEPICYQWVNDMNVKVSLQYSEVIMKALKMELTEMWDNKYDICANYIESYKQMISIIDNKEEMLKMWLDNYTIRGSFDDRTLVILKCDRR